MLAKCAMVKIWTVKRESSVGVVVFRRGFVRLIGLATEVDGLGPWDPARGCGPHFNTRAHVGACSVCQSQIHACTTSLPARPPCPPPHKRPKPLCSRQCQHSILPVLLFFFLPCLFADLRRRDAPNHAPGYKKQTTSDDKLASTNTTFGNLLPRL